jgi:hypothetical protein
MTQRTSWRPFAIWLAAGIVVGGVSLVIATAAAGGGHGSYGPASLLFPYTMLSTRLFESITLPFIGVALAQFPAYGAAVGWAARRSRPWKALGIVAAVHSAVALAAVYGRGGSFSP